MKKIITISPEQASISLFAAPSEKGSAEWQAWNVVGGDIVGAYRVAAPPIAREPRYPNIVHINRYPRHLIPKFGR